MLLLLLLLLQPLAEGQVIARLVVVGIVAKRLLIGFDGFAVLLVLLADDTHVMISLGTAHGVGLQLGSSVKLAQGQRVLTLHQQGIAKVVVSLRVAGILLDSLAVQHLSLSTVALAELLIAVTHQLAVGLGMGGKG